MQDEKMERFQNAVKDIEEKREEEMKKIPSYDPDREYAELKETFLMEGANDGSGGIRLWFPDDSVPKHIQQEVIDAFLKVYQ